MPKGRIRVSSILDFEHERAGLDTETFDAAQNRLSVTTSGSVREQVLSFKPAEPGFGKTQAVYGHIFQDGVRSAVAGEGKGETGTRAKRLAAADGKIFGNGDDNVRVNRVPAELKPN